MRIVHIGSGLGLLLLSACAVADGTDGTVDGAGGGAVGAGPGTGAGGGAVGAGTGGTPGAGNAGGVVGAGGTAAGNTGGGPAGNAGGAPAGNAGGAPAGNTGGVPAGNAGGTPATSTGGTPATSTGGTAGGGEITCSGASFFEGGYVDTGDLCGYAFGAAWDGASTDPEEFGSSSTEFCTTADLPVQDGEDGTNPYPGVMLGFGVKASKADGDNAEAIPAPGSGISFTITVSGANTDAGTIRIVANAKPAGGGTEYAYWLPASTGSGTVSASWSDLTTEPWEGGAGTAATGKDIGQIGVQVAAADGGAAQSGVKLCITAASVD